MKKARFSEEQILRDLKEHQACATVADLCRKHGISGVTFYNWGLKYGCMEVSDAKKLKGLEAENAKLKKLLAERVVCRFQRSIAKAQARKPRNASRTLRIEDRQASHIYRLFFCRRFKATRQLSPG